MNPTAPDAHASRPGNRSSMKQLWLVSALTYGMGQLANFLFQLRLLHLLGPSDYGTVGLAHLLLVTLIFLADLGYSALFLRETPGSADWEIHWRQALGHRLVATALLLSAGLAGGGLLWGMPSASWDYLCAAAPACLFALFNYASPMIVMGRRLGGLLVAQIAWPTALLCWWLLQDALPFSTSTTAGLSISLGYLLQAGVSIACSRNPVLWLPLPGKGQINAAFHLSLLGVCGSLHDRLTPFLLAPLVPTFLPFLLILSHILNGVSGVLAQLTRLLLPIAGNAQGRANAIAAASLLLWATTVALQAGLLVPALNLSTEQNDWLSLGSTVLLAWGISASSGFLTTLLISDRRERILLRLLVCGLVASALLQVCAAQAGEAGYLLWARVLGMLALLAGLMILLDLRLSLWGVMALTMALLVCAIGNTPWGLAAGAVLVFPALAGLLRRPACYVAATGHRT